MFKYDESAGDGVAISRIVSLYALDTFGNQSAVQTFSISAINEKPAYISGVYDSTNGFTADFTAPVILTDPAESLSAPVYEPVKINMPIYNNGNYTIQYIDVFGSYYSQDITVSAYDYFMMSQLQYPKQGPTNKDVVVTLNASGNDNVTLNLPAESGNI